MREDPTGSAVKAGHDSACYKIARVGDGLGLGFRSVGRGDEAKVDVSDVCLRELQRELGEPGRRLEKDWKDTCGQGIEGSGVPDAVRAGQSPKSVDDRERCLACALVDI